MLKHVIYNHKKILSEEEAGNLEKLVSEQTEKLQRYFKRYRKPLLLELILTEDDRQYHLTARLNMRLRPLIVKRKASEWRVLISEVFEVLRNEIAETLKKERREHLYKRKNRQIQWFDELVSHLEQSYEESDYETFGYLFKSGIPGLRSYLERRLQQAGMAGVPEDVINIDELVDELYTRVYERFGDYSGGDYTGEGTPMISWLYNIADNLLEEKLKEKNLLEHEDSFQMPERYAPSEQEVSFTIDAEGEIMPLEEFDDPVYVHNMYDVSDIFSDDTDEAEYIQMQVDQRMTQEEFHHFVSSELTKLPFFKRSVFDLYIIDRFETGEIAEIKNCKEKEAERALIEARSFLRERIRSHLKEDEPLG